MTQGHIKLAVRSIKTESAFKSEAGLLGIAIQNHPLLFLLLIVIVDISHFQLHLQPVLCGEVLLNHAIDAGLHCAIAHIAF